MRANFTYTPSVVHACCRPRRRLELDTDTFTVRVSDGQTFTDVPVTVVVRPRPARLRRYSGWCRLPIRRESR